MEFEDIMSLLENMGLGVFATVDKEGNPHARHIHIVAANQNGIFFMTGPETKFHQQLMTDERIALTAMTEEDYLIQVVRVEGLARPIESDRLKELFADNPYYEHIYQNQDSSSMQVFQIYEGKGFYHSLTQGHKYVFSIEQDKSASRVRTI